MLREAKGTVSIWVGMFPTKNELAQYVEDIYDDDGDSQSPFRDDFRLDWYDEDQREIGFVKTGEKSASELAVGHSHWESFAGALEAWTGSQGNSIVLLYDHEYVDTAPLPLTPLTFVAALPYKDLAPRQKPWLEVP